MPTEHELIVGCPKLAHEDSTRFARRWFVVDEAFVWHPGTDQEKLAGVEISIGFGNMVLRAPGMLRLDLPMDVIEDDDSVWRDAQIAEHRVKVVDEGDLAAVWFSNVIGKPCRLVKVHPDEPTPEI